DLISVGAAHTDGDTVVRFEKIDVMMIGDFYRNYGYPFVDPTHGGTFKGVLEALDVVMKLAGPKTVLVPGHGTLVRRADLARYADIIVHASTCVQRMISYSSSPQQLMEARLTAP